VIGHRELNSLVSKGILRREYVNTKTCPGIKVDMDTLRDKVRVYREAPPATLELAELTQAEKGEVKAALNLLERDAAQIFPNAFGELRDFFIHQEVINFRL